MNPHAAGAPHEYGHREVMDRSSQGSRALTRSPAVAGLFYPAEAEVLRGELRELLSTRSPESQRAHSPKAESRPAGSPRAVIVPHAGYRYSGRVAAVGFHELSEALTEERIVFLLGPPHRVYVRRFALPVARVFRTPLGDVQVNDEICRELLGRGNKECPVEESAEAHAQEHSLEVELPFLQTLAGENFSIVPLLVGDATPSAVADLLEPYLDDPRVVIVVSSDLSHFLDDESARRRDEETLKRILDLSTDELTGDEACGCRAVNGLVELARRKHLHPQLLGFENSADHGGPRNRVVGYGAVGFWQGDEA
jgi:MEMO1 family protein